MGAGEASRGGKNMRLVLGFCLAAWFVAGSLAAARAEQNMVRIAQPYGLGYLPSYVAVDQHLIEQYAKAAGLGDVQVTLTRMASGPAANDLLLAGDADIAMGGFGPAFTVWDKTHGAQQVRGVVPLACSPVFLVSNDPRIQSLRDYRDGDKISVSAIKVTDQAIVLQMAAAKEWGWDQRFRLDPLTISMSNPDALIAILSGAGEIRSHASIIPFSVTELESGKAHLVMTSDQYLDPGSSSVGMWAGARFHDPNPKLYQAVVAGFEDAIALINRDPHRAEHPRSASGGADLRRARAAEARPWLDRGDDPRSEADHLQFDAARHTGARAIHVQGRHAEARGADLAGAVLGERGGQAGKLNNTTARLLCPTLRASSRRRC